MAIEVMRLVLAGCSCQASWQAQKRALLSFRMRGLPRSLWREYGQVFSSVSGFRVGGSRTSAILVGGLGLRAACQAVRFEQEQRAPDATARLCASRRAPRASTSES